MDARDHPARGRLRHHHHRQDHHLTLGSWALAREPPAAQLWTVEVFTGPLTVNWSCPRLGAAMLAVRYMRPHPNVRHSSPARSSGHSRRCSTSTEASTGSCRAGRPMAGCSQSASPSTRRSSGGHGGATPGTRKARRSPARAASPESALARADRSDARRRIGASPLPRRRSAPCRWYRRSVHTEVTKSPQILNEVELVQRVDSRSVALAATM